MQVFDLHKRGVKIAHSLRNGCLQQKSAASVDRVHKIEAFHFCRLGVRKVDCARIVDLSRTPMARGWRARARLTRMSMPPKRSTANSTARTTAASSRTSISSGKQRPPAASISAAAVKIVPGSVGCGCAVFAAITIFAPSAASFFANARPIPLLPPDKKTVCPAKNLKNPAFR